MTVTGNIDTVAAVLYEEGWRSWDEEELKKEYNLSEEETVNLCNALRKFNICVPCPYYE